MIYMYHYVNLLRFPNMPFHSVNEEVRQRGIRSIGISFYSSYIFVCIHVCTHICLYRDETTNKTNRI